MDAAKLLNTDSFNAVPVSLPSIVNLANDVIFRSNFC